MTPEALVLHFIDDLDSKLNQLRAAREAAVLTNGISFSKGFGRYVYVPALPDNGNSRPPEPDPESGEDLRDLELQPPGIGATQSARPARRPLPARHGCCA